MTKTVETVPTQNNTRQALAHVAGLWADSVTDSASDRRQDLLTYKVGTVLDFFAYTGKAPGQVTEIDIKTWQAHLEAHGGRDDQPLAHSTVYGKISQLSSFYEWAKGQGQVNRNPVAAARPKAPKAYQTEKTQALADDEVIALLAVVRARADIVGRRDYALLLFYFLTGMRRQEIIRLTWGDIKINGTMTVKVKVKGGDYETREILEPHVKEALLAYLAQAGRRETIQPSDPLWVAHDRAGNYTGRKLSSHGFVKNLKRYARLAGLDHIHLHQTRHTFAATIADETGSMIATQDALGHKNLATTKVYVKRVGTKKDKYSNLVAARFGLGVDKDGD